MYENRDVLLPTITNIINTSLASGVVPPDFKTAIVKPLLKTTLPRSKCTEKLPSNLKPAISVENSWKGRSAQTSCTPPRKQPLQSFPISLPHRTQYRNHIPMRCKRLVKCYGWRQNLCFTLTGSFSCIWHYRYQILLSCLETVFGICSTALQWFQSYLLDRNQCVVVNNSASSSSPVMFGVPQGSVLGPALFVLYTTPLSDIANHSVNHQLFADDTQLQKSTPPNDMQSLTHDLQSCTDDIKTGMSNNQLKLNEDKTEAILFSTPLSSCHCLPSSIMVGTREILFSDSQELRIYPWL